MESKLEEGQFGFREGRETIDAIYVLNYVANRELSKKKGKLYIYVLCRFEKVAVGWIKRDELQKRMKEINISEKLRNRVMKIYEETWNVVRVNKGTGDKFKTTKGVRQDVHQVLRYSTYSCRIWRGN